MNSKMRGKKKLRQKRNRKNNIIILNKRAVPPYGIFVVQPVGGSWLSFSRDYLSDQQKLNIRGTEFDRYTISL